METNEVLPAFVELTALVYHEARNVRQLFRFNAASKHKFGALVDHLPPDPSAAWSRLITIQSKAAEADSAKTAEAVFVEQYGVTLDDLATLFDNPGWKRALGVGGSRWSAIAKAVAALGTLIDKKDKSANERVEQLLELPHNTGTVRNKLARLKAVPPRS